MAEQESKEPNPSVTVLPPKPVRLSVNLAPDVAAALKELVNKRGTSITEEIRRAISVYKFFEEQTSAGRKVLVDGGGDGRLLEVKFF